MMTLRRRSKIVVFRHPFRLNGLDRLLPPGGYKIVSESEMVGGMFYPIYHRISTTIFIPTQSHGEATETALIDPHELQTALDHDADRHKNRFTRSVRPSNTEMDSFGATQEPCR
jgi:hypothetical protein